MAYQFEEFNILSIYDEENVIYGLKRIQKNN